MSLCVGHSSAIGFLHCGLVAAFHPQLYIHSAVDGEVVKVEYMAADPQ